MNPNRPRPSRGRPQSTEKVSHILFNATTYDSQMKKKFQMGFKGITNSEFVEVLLRGEVAGNAQMLSKQKQIGF